MTLAPMLCDQGSVQNVERYLSDDNWWEQQKLDGDRVLMQIIDSHPTPYNRRGEPYRRKMVRQVLAEFEHPGFTETCVLDGELLNSHFHVFDVTMFMGVDLCATPLCDRYEILEGLFARWTPFHVSLCPMVKTEHGKRDLFNRVEASLGEGVVFKHRNGLYYPGLRSDQWLRHKFTETGDVVVTELWREGKRSVGIGAYQDGVLMPVGACTMTERNLGRVQVGSVIECRYLYLGAGGSLFQPRFVRLRHDKRAEECLVSQFKTVCKDVVELP